jgi:hypothetical protein
MQNKSEDRPVKGVSDAVSEAPAPMRTIMAENSRALETLLTKKSACSNSDKQSGD